MTDAAARNGARAHDALRRGWPVSIVGADGTLTVLAIETADELRLAAFDPAGTADVLLSAQRAAILKLANQREAATPGLPVVVARAPWLDLPAAVALADPALDLANPLKGPYRTRAPEAPDAARAALALAGSAGLLPALFARAGSGGEIEVTPADIAALDDPAGLRIVARARLPIAHAEAAEIVAFRGAGDAEEQVRW